MSTLQEDHTEAGLAEAEEGVFPPPRDFVERARIGSFEQYEQLYNEAARDPEQFWGAIAMEEMHWFEPFGPVLLWNEPYAQWFVGGKTNASYNCLDRQLEQGLGEHTALLWEGEPANERRAFTYAQLHRQVCRFANALTTLGIESGDRVAIYLPMTPELVVAMLACARIGAVHSVIFAGFSAQAIADRCGDAHVKLVITADAGWRRGRQLPLKQTVDEALTMAPSVECCIVLRRTGASVEMITGRDFWWEEIVDAASDVCPATPMDSEAPLFVLYTSGSTAKPKGIKHTTAGYQLYAKKTFEWVFDYRDGDVFWCTADIGWVTGHSHVVYGPLAAGATVLIYEGAPDFPDKDRFWEIVERYGVTIFHTAPTAIRAFIKWGNQFVEKHDLSSLRLLGTVGEGINPKAWLWYHQKIGRERCPIVDTWWQTETGAAMFSPLPGAIATKPGSCARPLPGVIPRIVGSEGNDVGVDECGQLAIAQPWPGMLRGIWGDDKRYRQAYWSEVPGCYTTGDYARIDKDGYYWIMGRTDDVMNVSGHRLSSIEIESALVSHQRVAEAAVVSRPDELKGESVTAFVTLRDAKPSNQLRDELRSLVRSRIGPLAAPDEIHFADAVPKTRSGKIMRRLLRDIAAGRESKGDTTTLEDRGVLAQLREETK